jgi:Excreted virulence factor EspC, type VII ESX diderm
VGDTVQMPFEAVLSHAGSVDGVAGDLRTAHAAANQVYLDAGAFGQICSFVPGMFDPVLRSAVESINSAVEALTDSSGKLRAAVSRQQAADETSSSTINTAGNHNINLPL